MPDDEKTVTEQTTAQAEPAPDNPADENAGFKTDKVDEAEDRHGMFTDGLDKPAKEPAKEEPAKSEGEEEPHDEPPEEESDEDEDIKRGRELIDEQEKAEAAEKEKQAAEQQPDQRAQPTYDPRKERQTPEGIEFFRGVIPKDLFPQEPIKLKDGTELDFSGILKNDPEIPVMAAIIANNLIKQMVANGYLMTADHAGEIRSEFDNRLFMRTLTNKQDGIPEAKKIYADPKFKEWLGKEPKEVQSLMKSNDPYDHIRVFRRFLGKSGMKAASEKVSSLDRKRAEDKAKADAIYKTTIRSKGKPNAAILTPREQEEAGFHSKDKGDDF